MITSLTEAQEKQLAIYRDKWIEIGLKTGPANRARAEKLIIAAYEAANLTPPKEIVWFDSPFAAKKHIEENKLEDYACYGQHDANWLSFYDYFYEVMGDHVCEDGKTMKELIEPLKPLIELAKEVGWFWCYDEACFVSERPVRLDMKKREDGIKVLHNEHGPALLYKDGLGGYYLNGVRMYDNGRWVTEAFEDTIDPKIVHSIENAEVRQEIIKKIGLDNLFTELKTATVDTFDTYELIDLKITEEENGRYLKMINPSTGQPHVEGVPNECQNVKQALMWRNGVDNFTEVEYVAPRALT